MLDGVTAPDAIADRFPIDDFETYFKTVTHAAALWRMQRKTADEAKAEKLRETIRQINRKAVRAQKTWASQTLLRWAYTPSGFRERLVSFWTDHFTAVGKTALLRYANPAYVESVIRPNVAAPFEDLLIAAVTHPVMMDYLDQLRSAGPNSVAIGRNPTLKGLNENLAREVLELHTLGVRGGYEQTDVREFAELLTGLTYSPRDGMIYRKAWAEPGAETVMGVTYRDQADVSVVHDALRDLARHPSTATHMARKLAVHFVSDTPPIALISDLEARWLETDGDLTQVYEVLLTHPRAWDPAPANVKPPFDFMGSALRALAIPVNSFDGVEFPRFRRLVFQPLALMGQPWLAPNGPDGWPEEDIAWLTPQGLSARLRWAMSVPQILSPDLPDPREFVTQALGGRVSQAVRQAAFAAESRPEAIGLVLCAPAFQRR